MTEEFIPKGIVSRNHTVVEFTDQYGDKRTIHRGKNNGNALRIKKREDSPSHLLNRAAAILIGQNIRKARREAGYGPGELLERAGLAAADGLAKSRMYEIEKAGASHQRNAQGIRFGTLYALALALGVEPMSLMPTAEEVRTFAGIEFVSQAPRLSTIKP